MEQLKKALLFVCCYGLPSFLFSHTHNHAMCLVFGLWLFLIIYVTEFKVEQRNIAGIEDPMTQIAEII